MFEFLREQAFSDGVFENKTTLDRFYGSRIAWNQHGGWKVRRAGPPFAQPKASVAPPFAVFKGWAAREIAPSRFELFPPSSPFFVSADLG